MRYSIVMTISIDAPSRVLAEQATKELYAGVWDLMPELPAPAVTAVLFDGSEVLRKIDASSELKGPK